jgi:uncharacterized membrane protein YedE/YeeE
MQKNTWKEYLVYFTAGVLFAVGLAISGMTQPHKIVRFLDVTGNWEADLLFVMGGAVLSYSILLRLIVRREAPLFGGTFSWPTRKDIDWRLLGGAATFGLGWGAAGFCPGPALASLASLKGQVFVFVASMLVGMFLFNKINAAMQKQNQNDTKS